MTFVSELEPTSLWRYFDEILTILESADEAYDQRIVAVLKDVVNSTAGKKLLARRS